MALAGREGTRSEIIAATSRGAPYRAGAERQQRRLPDAKVGPDSTHQIVRTRLASRGELGSADHPWHASG
jgi:hypothetical protein